MTFILQDYITMTRRQIRHMLRNFDVLLTAVVLPVAMLILFVTVFGGAMNTGGTSYLQYIVPGIVMVTIGYCASVTAVSVFGDLEKGIVDRFRSMPVAKSSFLAGHVAASVLRNIVATACVLLTAMLMGYRIAATPMGWLVAILVLLLYTLAITYISVMFGLLAKSAEGAGAFGFTILFLPYLSSGFAPTGTMPAALRAFAERQPITVILEAVRAALDNTANTHLPGALLWGGGLTLTFAIISVRLFEGRAAK
jgi:ABC-2 type transport system permease protein